MKEIKNEVSKVIEKSKLMSTLAEKKMKLELLHKKLGSIIVESDFVLYEEAVAPIKQEVLEIQAIIADTKQKLEDLSPTVACKNCGQRVPREMKYCGQCGERMPHTITNEKENASEEKECVEEEKEKVEE